MVQSVTRRGRILEGTYYTAMTSLIKAATLWTSSFGKPGKAIGHIFGADIKLHLIWLLKSLSSMYNLDQLDQLF